MPKVSEQYYKEKKQFIIGKLRELAKKKPIYAITMQELITSTEMSQGAIYRYFKDIDEVIGALYEELSQQQMQVEDDFRRIINQSEEGDQEQLTPEDIIYNVFQCIADFYTEEGSVFNEVNKIIWELNILYQYDKKRVNKIVRDTEKNNITVRIKKHFIDYIISHIENGYFKPIVTVEKCIALLTDCFDGIVRNYYILNCYEKKNYTNVQLEMKDIYSMLDGMTLMTIHLLGGDCKKFYKKTIHPSERQKEQ